MTGLADDDGSVAGLPNPEDVDWQPMRVACWIGSRFSAPVLSFSPHTRTFIRLFNQSNLNGANINSLSVLDSNSRGYFQHSEVYFLPRLHLILLFTTSRGAICTKWDLLTLFSFQNGCLKDKLLLCRVNIFNCGVINGYWNKYLIETYSIHIRDSSYVR